MTARRALHKLAIVAVIAGLSIGIVRQCVVLYPADRELAGSRVENVLGGFGEQVPLAEIVQELASCEQTVWRRGIVHLFYLNKPFSSDEVSAVLQAIIDNRCIPEHAFRAFQSSQWAQSAHLPSAIRASLPRQLHKSESPHYRRAAAAVTIVTRRYNDRDLSSIDTGELIATLDDVLHGR